MIPRSRRACTCTHYITHYELRALGSWSPGEEPKPKPVKNYKNNFLLPFKLIRTLYTHTGGWGCPAITSDDDEV
jgi:hypothetical protein